MFIVYNIHMYEIFYDEFAKFMHALYDDPAMQNNARSMCNWQRLLIKLKFQMKKNLN